MKKLFTVGQIAEQIGVPIHRVTYIIRARKIRPRQRMRHYRLFDSRQVGRILAALKA